MRVCGERDDGAGKEGARGIHAVVRYVEEVGIVFPDFGVLRELLDQELKDLVGFL